MIRNFRDYMTSAPDQLTAYAALLDGPDVSPLVEIGISPMLSRLISWHLLMPLGD